jgi:hypothetical protein
MGLVNELQESAERDDVLTVLRKAKRVSAKLNLSEISEWLDYEQNGYPDGKSVPLYREVLASFCYNTNGYIPAGYGYLKNGIVPIQGPPGVRLPVLDSISTIASWIANLKQGTGLYQSVPPKFANSLRSQLRCARPGILERLTFMAQLDDSQVRDIPEQVKNKVLDWACALESAGVTGDGHSFSMREKQDAQAVIFNITNSTIDQLNNAGANVKWGNGQL